VSLVQLLLPGPEIVSLYADASFADEVGIGCWAYSVPAFSILNSGVEPGCSNNRLELSAAVHGLASVISLDASKRAIHIYTDSDFVVGIMEHISKRERMPDRKSYRRVADLYTKACDIGAARSLAVMRRVRGDPHHRTCDQRAREGLRGYCTQGELARTILLKRAEARRAGVLNEIRTLERSLKQLESRLLQCDMEIAAVRADDSGSPYGAD
jgi:ribonuclease HI